MDYQQVNDYLTSILTTSLSDRGSGFVEVVVSKTSLSKKYTRLMLSVSIK